MLHPQQPGLEDPRGGPGHARAGGGREARAHERGRRPRARGARRAGAARRRRAAPPRQQVAVMCYNQRDVDAGINRYLLHFLPFTHFFIPGIDPMPL